MIDTSLVLVLFLIAVFFSIVMRIGGFFNVFVNLCYLSAVVVSAVFWGIGVGAL